MSAVLIWLPVLGITVSAAIALFVWRRRELRENQQERKADTAEARRLLADLEAAFRQLAPLTPQELDDFSERLRKVEADVARALQPSIEVVSGKLGRRSTEEVRKAVVAGRERIDTYIRKGR